ncbi:hypothetical protein AUR65_002120 [Haloferax marisrubri]|uniref:Methanogenesis regulatory protein FilR1 middle domain-containing protein n=1 Tax=Haloferax marisrubri TaxID=1544719 RepID=A0A2P4NVR0_9EURY|nr:hypothetical protein AUR65_002120 [Haloferax marisrubri]
MVHDQYEEFVGTVECADRMSEFLANATEVCEGVPPGVLSQMNITTAADNDPHAPLNRYLTIVGSEPVDRFRGVTPIVSRVFNESAASVIGPDTRMELVVDREVLERSIDAYSESFERAQDLEQFELRITDETLGFGLLLVDGHGVVSAYDDHNNLTALIDGDAPEVVSWVEDLYESVRSTSVPLDRLES